MSKPVYVVQTEVISLGGKPFLLEDEVKPPFKSLFTSKICFTDLRQTILDSSRYIQQEDSFENGQWPIHKPQLVPLPGNPFIPGWSQICFNTRSLLFSDTEERTQLAQKLAQREKFWDKKAKKTKVPGDIDVFGFDPQLDDQRMNMLYFEIYNPLYLTAFFEKRKMATGKVFLHIYPSGYIVFHLAVCFTQDLIHDNNDLKKIILETQPWRRNHSWQWKSRVTHGSLEDVFDFLFQLTVTSLLEPRFHKKIKKQNWYTCVKFLENWNMDDLARLIFNHNIKSVGLKRYDEYYKSDDFKIMDDSIQVNHKLVTAKEGFLIWLPNYYHRKKALGQFWKILEMAEFTLLKDQFYDDLASYLRPETEKLQDYRLDKKRKLTKESLLKFTIYKPEIPQMMAAFEKHLHSATGFYRFIHSCIADGIGHYEKKEKVKKLVDQWIVEIEKWKPNFTIIWTSVIGPLKEILSLIK